MVEKGFNSDINIKGQSYHVQSEDRGFRRAYMVIQVFKSGLLVKTTKIPYAEVLPETLWEDSLCVEQALKAQHSLALKNLISGER